MRKISVSNVSFAFASAITIALFLFFNFDNDFHFLGIVLSSRMTMKGIYFIIGYAFMVVFDDSKTLIRWTAILTVITGLLIAGFSGWKTILVSIFSTSIGIVSYTGISKSLKNNAAGIVAVSTFSTATAIIIETVVMALIEKSNMQVSIIASIIAGFFFGILAGVGVIGANLIIAGLSVPAKHKVKSIQQLDLDL